MHPVRACLLGGSVLFVELAVGLRLIWPELGPPVWVGRGAPPVPVEPWVA